jgi:protein SCO1/2
MVFNFVGVNTKALYGLMLAALVPLVSYFIVKQFSRTAVVMPRHYVPDTVITKTKNGKLFTDTLWHSIPGFTLYNQLGNKISLNDMITKDSANKVIVADFFFTHCPTICPSLTLNMKRLQESITNSQRVGNRSPDFIQFLSFSIDPERDSVERLKYWADRFQINPEQWWLLTGDKKTIYDLSINDMKLSAVDGEGVDTSFIHTDIFVLIDRNRHIRGYYHGLDSTDLSRLSNDIILLSLEKDPNAKSFFAGKLQLIAVVVLMALIGVGIFLYFFKKSKKNAVSHLEKK